VHCEGADRVTVHDLGCDQHWKESETGGEQTHDDLKTDEIVEAAQRQLETSNETTISGEKQKDFQTRVVGMKILERSQLQSRRVYGHGGWMIDASGATPLTLAVET
jgi:hypothetical protein